MGLFPEAIAAALSGRKVECAFLVRFDFASETVRLWQGDGTLKTVDGAEWQGLGRLGDLNGIEQAVNGEAPQATFTLSGVDAEIQRLARDEFAAEVKGRRVVVLIQFFGDPAAGEGNQRPLDLPYAVYGGRCLTPTFEWRPDGTRSIAIAAETLFSLRSRPRYAMNTDRDQQLRFPGDKGFEFVGSLVNKVVTWPDY